MLWRRPFWIWGAAVVVSAAGVLAGPAIWAVAETLRFSLQPRSYVFGWEVIALVAAFGALWLAAVYATARRLRGKAGLLFVAASLLVAVATVVYEALQPPDEVTHGTLSGAEAAAWRTIANDLPHPRRRP